MFFYFCFSNKFGYDQICWDDALYGKPGDLIESNGSHFLVLGDAISWQEQYMGSTYQFPIQQYEIIWNICGPKTLELIHWMVYHYYTSYKSVVTLFVWNVTTYLKQQQKAKTLKSKDAKKYSDYNSIKKSDTLNREDKLTVCHEDKVGQTLIVFPDLLSLYYRFDDKEYMVTAKDADSKIVRYYHDLQMGYKNILITTSANICMDYRNLTQIICYFPKTRYYKYQHDPRIWVPEVLEKMAQVRGASFVCIDV
jgi:hypothetical protein